jgi:cytochrome b561
LQLTQQSISIQTVDQSNPSHYCATMNPKNSVSRYTTVAILFHWLLALAIIGTLGFGLYMTDLPFSPARVKQYNWHKWAGITILFLSAARLLWRLTHKAPDLPDSTIGWQRKASHWAHMALYVLFFAVPLVGWAYSSAAGFQVVYFGLVPLPDWVSVDPDNAKLLKSAHHLLSKLLAATVLLHIAAALKHQFINKDHLLLRMMPGSKHQ